MSIMVNEDRYNALKSALQRATGESITIYEMNSSFNDKNLSWGVNWSALGTQNPQDTLNFAEELKDAAAMAKALNDMDLELVWEDDPALEYVEAIYSREEAIQLYRTLQERIYDCLIVQNWAKLEKILNDTTDLMSIV